MRIWLIIVGMGLLTYAIRLSLIVLADRITLPALVQRGLRYVPPAVLSAIVLPELLYVNGAGAPCWANPRLIAGLVAILIAWRTRNALFTIGAGMAVFWILGSLL